MSTGHDYSWFTYPEHHQEGIRASGSEHNPDLTGKSWRMTLKRATNKGVPVPVEAFKEKGADFIVRDNLADLVGAMNGLSGENSCARSHQAQIQARDRRWTNPSSRMRRRRHPQCATLHRR